MWQIFLLQYKPHNIHAHQDQQICLHLQIFSHNIQATRRSPKGPKKRKEEAYMYHGEQGIKSLKCTPSLEEGLGKNNFMKFESLIWVLSTNPQSASLG